MALPNAGGGAHDELEVGEVVAVLGPDHEKAPLLVVARLAVQAVAAVEHEDLEGRHAVRGGERLHLVHVRGGDGRQVIGVVAVKAPLGDPQHLGKEVGVGAAAVEVVLARAEVVQHRGHTPRDGGAALGERVLGEGSVDAGVGVGVDDARKPQSVARVVHLARLGGGDLGRDARVAAVLDAQVQALHAGRVRAHHAHVLDEQVEDTLVVHAAQRRRGAGVTRVIAPPGSTHRRRGRGWP